MKFIFFICINFSVSSLLIGQEFSFDLCFEDSKGNKDTLTIGYDELAKDSIDTVFNEINIIALQLDTVFDVRISNGWNNSQYYKPGTFSTKKQIVKKKDCNEKYIINSIDIFSKNWPVTVSWDSTLFVDPCLEGSLFTDFNPGGWWDVGGSFISVFKNMSSISFFPDSYFGEYSAYINGFGDTLDVFWQTFGDKSILEGGDVKEFSNLDIKIFPNPCKNEVYFDLNEHQNEFDKIRLFDIDGKEFPVLEQDSKIDMKDLKSGIYLFKIQFKTGYSKTVKLLKN